jgi:hypothetical protein
LRRRASRDERARRCAAVPKWLRVDTGASVEVCFADGVMTEKAGGENVGYRLRDEMVPEMLAHER